MNRIVTLCGSTRFREHFDALNEMFSMNGDLVFSCGVWDGSMSSEIRDMLNSVHKEKIRLSDVVFVINVGGYISESVKSDIKYAKKLGKEINYLEKLEDHKVECDKCNLTMNKRIDEYGGIVCECECGYVKIGLTQPNGSEEYNWSTESFDDI